MSQWLADYTVNDMGIDSDKVHVVGAGSNVHMLQNSEITRTGKRFLFVGKSWECKNGLLVLEAFRILQQKRNDVELFIIGPEEFPFDAERYPNVFFMGRLPYDEVSRYYAKCDFLVLPSHFEAYGIAIIEALINGLPCIARNEYAMKEFIIHGENGLLLDHEDPNELYTLMENMITNQDKYKCIVEAHRQDYYKQYTWDAVAEKIVKVIENDMSRMK